MIDAILTTIFFYETRLNKRIPCLFARKKPQTKGPTPYRPDKVHVLTHKCIYYDKCLAITAGSMA